MTSVYLHIPFCLRKCPYCAFSSAPMRDGDEALFLEAVERELVVRGRRAKKIETLYIGGGTPSVLSGDVWRKLHDLLEGAFFFSDDAEVTVEANPNSLTAEQLMLWRDWRVTRVSLGVQSFDDAELQFLGRLHDARTAVDAVVAARAAGFAVSLDLMFGLPGSNVRNWARSLHEAVAIRPGHISVYQLTVEKGTPFAEKNFTLPDGYDQYRYAQWYLPKKNYFQYEVASFATPGRESRHNANYWADGDYIGIGPGAWGYEGGVRYRNAPLLADYARMMAQGGNAVAFEERLEGEPAVRQAAVLALRTARGIDWRNFSERYGKNFTDAIKKDIETFPNDLFDKDETSARLTPKGMR
ncbi:radical SAM family heme chaperone HemW, partial [Synergistaceae bacterium OttesenSCG-928-I11]|nr:radical SAM family heme chaperone HemW [Synergistaceae bacterium OttesenSCG-928-I11]